MKIVITGMSTLAAEALTLHNNIPQGKLSERNQALISALQASNPAYEPLDVLRSEERRVGKECRSRWSPYH